MKTGFCNTYLTIPRDHFVYVPSQWETALPYNIISHWLGTHTKWSLHPKSRHVGEWVNMLLTQPAWFILYFLFKLKCILPTSCGCFFNIRQHKGTTTLRSSHLFHLFMLYFSQFVNRISKPFWIPRMPLWFKPVWSESMCNKSCDNLHWICDFSYTALNCVFCYQPVNPGDLWSNYCFESNKISLIFGILVSWNIRHLVPQSTKDNLWDIDKLHRYFLKIIPWQFICRKLC